MLGLLFIILCCCYYLSVSLMSFCLGELSRAGRTDLPFSVSAAPSSKVRMYFSLLRHSLVDGYLGALPLLNSVHDSRVTWTSISYSWF